MRTITVKGTGHVSVPPDQVQISLNVSLLNEDYETSAILHNEKIGFLYQEIIDAGFKREDLKTLKFEVESTREYEKDKYVFKGYKVKSIFVLEFDLNKERMNKIMKAIGKQGSTALFSIKFQVKDKEAVKDKLIENAVADSIKKAELMAKRAGVNLGKIQAMNYSWSEIRFEAEEDMMDADASMLLADSQPNYDINPDNIEAKDTVSVVWEIS